MKALFSLVRLSALTFALAPFAAHSATCPPGQLCNPTGFGSLYEFLQGILQVAIAIGFPIIVLFIIYIGFRFVQASATGNSKELDEAKKNIWWALVGALILLGAQALSLAIQGTIEGLTRGL